jgi:hypothetical protein
MEHARARYDAASRAAFDPRTARGLPTPTSATPELQEVLE